MAVSTATHLRGRSNLADPILAVDTVLEPNRPVAVHDDLAGLRLVDDGEVRAVCRRIPEERTVD